MDLVKEYIDTYNMIDTLTAKLEQLKAELVNSDFQAGETEDGYKLSRIITQKFSCTKTIDELGILYPDAVDIVETKKINIDMLKGDPENGHQYLECTRSETVKVTKPKKE